MKTVEFCWKDITKEKRKEVAAILGMKEEELCDDFAPIFAIDFEEEEEDSDVVQDEQAAPEDDR